MTDDQVAPSGWGPSAALWASVDRGRLTASFSLMTAVLDGAGLDDLLGMVATRARSIAGAQLAFIALPAENGNILRVTVAVGTDSDRIRGMTVRRGRSIIGRVFSNRRPLSARIAVDQALSGLPAGPILLVPMETSEAIRGVLAVIGEAGDLPVSASVIRNLSLFATMSTTLIELAEDRRTADGAARLNSPTRGGDPAARPT